MTVDPSVVPGLLFLLAELVTLAGVGYVIVRAALRETDQRVALAQGLIVGPAIWGLVVNFVMYATPGMAGAVAGWIFVLGLAAVLVWRAPESIRPRLRVAAGFALIALTLFWIALASRQTLGIDDDAIRLGLPASIREGGFPPELPWNPGMTAPYHYGVNLLHGLLAPPSGPDLAFAKELLGAYAWICLALVVATALLRRASGFAMLIIAPLLLTAGASTLVFNQPAGVVQAPVPTGIPSAGVRASLTEIYRPAVDLPRNLAQEAPPNISKPHFTLSYALALVVLVRAACAGRRSWLSVTTLGALVGFLGLTSSTLAPIVLVLWAGLEAVWLIQSRRAGSAQRGDAVLSVSGLALAALLLLAGSFSILIPGSSVTSGLSLGGNEYVEGRRMLGTLDRLPGGVGVLGLGPLGVAGVALLLARRDRLVQALAAGTCLLLPAALLLNYEPQPLDIVRIEGHARNFALFALLVALSVRLADLRPARLRYAAAAALLAVVTWPTIAAPVRNVGLAVGNGIELTNAQPKQYAPGTRRDRRYVLKHLISNRIADYIRSNTAVDARVFSPYGDSMTFATGRPNAMGFPGLVHQFRVESPEYRDGPQSFGAGGHPAAGLRIRSRARRVGGEPARRGGHAARRSPPVRAPCPRRIREPLPRLARVSQAPHAARAGVVRGAAAGRARVRNGVFAAIYRLRVPEAEHGSRSVGAVPHPAARRHRPDSATVADAMAGPAARRPCARPRHCTGQLRALDATSRIAAANLVE